MSAEGKKPFAKVRVDQNGYADLHLGEGSTELFLDDNANTPRREPMLADLERTAERINAAVEAREARLLGRLGSLQHSVSDAMDGCDPEGAAWEILNDGLKESGDDETDYVSRDVAGGYAFDLGMAQGELEKLKGVWSVLLDAMLETGGQELTAAAVGIMMKLGIKLKGQWVPLSQRMDSVTDDELRAECERRRLTIVPRRLEQMRDQREGWVAEWPGILAQANASAFGIPTPISSTPEHPMPIRITAEGRLPALDGLPRYLQPIPANGQAQWQDAEGRWHDYDGNQPPAAAVRARVVYRGRAPSIVR